MIEYFVVSIICILITFFQKKGKNALLFSFILLTAFFAVRYDFGNDYQAYQLHFELANEGALSDVLYTERFETGWVILCRICKPIGFFGMVIFLTIFENVVLYYLIKKYVPQDWHWLALFCYLFTTSLCLTGLSMMRQFLAMCICLLAFNIAVRGKILFPVLFVLLAGQVHTSAYACLPVCLIGMVKDYRMSSKALILLIIVLLVVFYFFAITLFGGYLERLINDSVFEVYEGRIEQGNKSIIGVSTIFYYYIIGIILFMLRKQESPNGLFVLIFLLSVIIDAFKPIAPLINRVGLYFYILYPVCLPNAIEKLSNTLMKKVTILLLLLFGVYGYFSFILSPGWGGSFYEYKTIFSAMNWM